MAVAGHKGRMGAAVYVTRSLLKLLLLCEVIDFDGATAAD
jgi:hypothetical protein